MNFKLYNKIKYLGTLALLVFFSLFITGCSTTPTTSASNNINKANYDYYTVQSNDTLSSIAKKFNSTTHSIIESNNLRPPHAVQVGQQLRIPIKTQKNAVAKNTVTKVRTENWIWPTKGKIVKTFAESAANSKGIDIAGHQGQTIVASISGMVVYSGAGLDNYGDLIIIKHNENLLTAYGFIKNSLVKEGEIVSQGEKIAEMDTNDKGHAILHFEIRENGKTIDPLLYLKVK
jgi:lipoprotein NlpD